MLLDTARIHQRRHELGLSQRAVGRQLGVSSSTIARIEDGSNHDDLPLRLVSGLADLLALDMAELFSWPAADEGNDGDVERVGALLSSAERPVATSVLSDALGTALSETEGLLRALDHALRSTGLRLHTGPDGSAIVPDIARRDAERLERLLRGQHAAHGLNSLDAVLLARAHAGTLDLTRLSNAEQVTLARLHNAGMLDGDDLTDDVAYSLGLS